LDVGGVGSLKQSIWLSFRTVSPEPSYRVVSGFPDGQQTHPRDPHYLDGDDDREACEP
jgi:hypothetical protein